MKKQYGIRMTGETAATVENFAEVHKMSSTAAAEFFVRFGIESLHKSDSIDARFDRLEDQLKAMQKANYKALVYLTTATARDQPRFEQAEAIANKNVSEIFGEEEK